MNCMKVASVNAGPSLGNGSGLTEWWRREGCGTSRQNAECSKVIELRFIAASAVPPNQRMELTAKSVTPLAGARRAPLSSAAHASR
jgi:hypothetical protein